MIQQVTNFSQALPLVKQAADPYRNGRRVANDGTVDEVEGLAEARAREKALRAAGKPVNYPDVYSGVTVKRTNAAGVQQRIRGMAAYNSLYDEYGRPINAGNQMFRVMNMRGVNPDSRDGMAAQLGASFRNMADSPRSGWFESLLGSPTGSTLAGGTLGGGIGALVASLTGFNPMVGGLIGAGLGSATGYKANRIYDGKDALPDISQPLARAAMAGQQQAVNMAMRNV